MNSTRTEKIDALQGIRGFAILMIALSHCSRLTDAGGQKLFDYVGGAGVSLFILLSGYLAVLRHTQHPITDKKAYLFGKLQKFYPLYFVTLLISLPFAWRSLLGVGTAAWKGWANLLLNMLQLQTWVPKRSVYFAFNAVSWYLSLTVFLVWMTPWMVRRAAVLFQGGRAGWGLFVIFAVEFIWCILVSGTSIAHWLIYIAPPVRLLDYLAGGGICYFVQRRRERLGQPWTYGAGLAVAALAYVVLNRPDRVGLPETYSYTCLWLIPNALLLVMAAESGTSGLVRAVVTNRVIVFLGNISFELFLIHQLAIRYMDHLWQKLHLPCLPMGYVLALGASAAAAYLWQKWSVSIKRRRQKT